MDPADTPPSDLRARLALAPERLARRVDPAELPFASTAEVPPLEGTVGQPRAVDAVEFGVEVQSPGYNLFVAGEQGSGRETTVRDHLDRVARARAVPPDWVYVHNFATPDRPVCFALPAGRASRFAREMDALVRNAQRELRRAFETDEYARRRRDALAAFNERRAELFNEVTALAAELGFHVEATPRRFVTVPLIGGEPATDERFAALSPEQRRELAARTEQFELRVTATVHKMRALDREAEERAREVDRDAARAALAPLLDELGARYADVPAVAAFLAHVRDEMPTRIDEFVPPASRAVLPENDDDNDDAADEDSAAADGDADERADAGDPPADGDPPSAASASAPAPAAPAPAPAPAAHPAERFARYRVNVLIDRAAETGAPVVFESNPTPQNLAGRVDYRIAGGGAVVTDFLQLKPGALQRANGGFLILRALDVLQTEGGWTTLKRALLGREARIDAAASETALPLPATALRPEPVPLDVKVILIGSPWIYQLLYHRDEDFRALFKVKVEFAPDMEWTADNLRNYAAFVSRCVRDRALRHFEAGAIARAIEYGARLREHQRRLSTRMLEIADAVTEASFWAGKAGHAMVQAGDVERAIEAREGRSNLLETRVRDAIAEGTLQIETRGAAAGQVNGLSVVDLGDHAFGMPLRVTATVAPGRSGVVSIERETDQSGPSHTKGVLTLAGYLAAQYTRAGGPLALAATLAIEQSYDPVDGDSASLAELLALLSALGGLPVDQGVAVTGSLDQHGRLQAVGGVTRKVEGFFATCRAAGFTGAQGVVLPAANAQHLMLAPAVAAAARAGQFHVWAARTVDEAIELVTGCAAGAPDAAGRFPEGTAHARVQARLQGFAERVRWLGASARERE